MSKKLFVGGMSFNTTEEGLREAFGAFGPVAEIQIITDRDTGRSRGFGFVSFASDGDAQKALEQMNGAQLDGRTLRVDHATDRQRGGGRSRQSRW